MGAVPFHGPVRLRPSSAWTRVNHLPSHVFHLAERQNLPSIHQHGLLSTSALLDLVALSGAARKKYEQYRSDLMELPGGLVIRDQRPMPPRALERCLIRMTVSQWYALLNSKVFFWCDIERLHRQRKACHARPQVVLTVDTERLLERYGTCATLSPINTGNARRRPVIRGEGTFVPYWDWLRSRWGSESASLGTRTRSHSHRPVELSITGAVPDIMNFVVSLAELGST